MSDILAELYMKFRKDAVLFLKSLWRKEPQPRPLCKGELDYLHKKAKRAAVTGNAGNAVISAGRSAFCGAARGLTSIQ